MTVATMRRFGAHIDDDGTFFAVKPTGYEAAAIAIEPVSGGSMPQAMPSNVDFPVPFSPTMTVIAWSKSSSNPSLRNGRQNG